jgi:hypothetical protein
MRMLKTLAAVATGILLLTLPAVATPQAPTPAPAPDECTAPAETDQQGEKDQQADQKTKSTAAEPGESCAAKYECASDPDVVGTTTCVLGADQLGAL